MVITNAIVTNAFTSNCDTYNPLNPMLCAAISATFNSYCKAPMTDKRNQEKGTPKVPLKAITPNKILIDGNKVNVALDKMVFFNTFSSIPICNPAL